MVEKTALPTWKNGHWLDGGKEACLSVTGLGAVSTVSMMHDLALNSSCARPDPRLTCETAASGSCSCSGSHSDFILIDSFSHFDKSPLICPAFKKRGKTTYIKKVHFDQICDMEPAFSGSFEEYLIYCAINFPVQIGALSMDNSYSLQRVVLLFQVEQSLKTSEKFSCWASFRGGWQYPRCARK